MKVLIIIPAYNEEKNLPGLLSKIKSEGKEYDILVVNDCSTDRTLEVCKAYGVKTIDLPVNLGIGGAVQSGYKYACINDYDIAVQVDGDGQHDPRYIDDLIEGIKRGANLCIGSRFIEKKGFQSTYFRRIGIKYFSGLIRFVTGKTITDPTSGFRACDRVAIRLFARNYPMDYPEPETVVFALKNHLNVAEVPVQMNERVGGKSSINWLRSVYYMIKVGWAVVIASMSSGNGGK